MVLYKQPGFFDYLKYFFQSLFQVNQNIQLPNRHQERMVFFKD